VAVCFILRAVKIPGFRLRGFKRIREALTSELGELEREVMTLMWRDGEVSVREAHQSLGGDRAYTTVMTTLDRLFKKGLVTRRKCGRAFLYSPRVSRDEFERGLAEDVLEGLFSRAEKTEPLLACIVEAVGDRDRELLDELDRLVKIKRQELGREDSE
jgi:predicted transcriptional regulator